MVLGTTHVIDLRDGADAVRARWKKEQRAEVRRALRAEVQVREARTWSDWLAYFQNYLETRKLWKTPTSTYDLELFRLLWEADSPAVRLWLAEQRGLVVGGIVMFVHADSAVAWHGAQAPRGTGASNLLHWEILASLEAEGIRTYDLNPSGGHQGVVKHKESLAAEPVPYAYLVRRHPLERTLAAAGARSRLLLRR
jgi:hypothetical protein